ncbi:hypothetical protein MPER_02924, partial [Moniliophthora perniciosa FA553]
MLPKARPIVYAFRKHYLNRNISTRASGILSALNIPTTGEIHGVFDGQWKGSGEVMQSLCPTTGEVLARVKTATPEETAEALLKTREAYALFR